MKLKAANWCFHFFLNMWFLGETYEKGNNYVSLFCMSSHLASKFPGAFGIPSHSIVAQLSLPPQNVLLSCGCDSFIVFSVCSEDPDPFPQVRFQPRHHFSLCLCQFCFDSALQLQSTKVLCFFGNTCIHLSEILGSAVIGVTVSCDFGTNSTKSKIIISWNI